MTKTFHSSCSEKSWHTNQAPDMCLVVANHNLFLDKRFKFILNEIAYAMMNDSTVVAFNGFLLLNQLWYENVYM